MDIQKHISVVVLLSSLSIVACGPSKKSNKTPNSTAKPVVISGEIRNLGGSLTVSLNDEHEETFSAGWYSFEDEVPKGTEYTLLITAQPDNQFCSFDGPEFGVIEDEFNLNIDCVDNLMVTVNEGVQGNGSPSRITRFEMNALSLPTSLEYDANADGVAEYDYQKLYNSTGQTIQHTNSDGWLEKSRYDDQDRNTDTWTDEDGDGHFDAYSKFIYLPDSEPNYPTERYEDRDNDGSWDYIQKSFDTKCGLLYSQDRNGNGVLEFNLGDRETIVTCSQSGGLEIRHRYVNNLLDYTETESSSVDGEGNRTVRVERFFNRERDPNPDTIELVQTNPDGKELLEQRWTTYNHPSDEIYITYEFRSNYDANGRLESTRQESWTYGRQPSLIYKYYNTAGQLVRDVRRAQDNLPITAETLFAYNSRGLLSTATRETPAEISVTTHTYYSSGRKRTSSVAIDEDKNGTTDVTVNYQEFAEFDLEDEPYPAQLNSWRDNDRNGFRDSEVTNTYYNRTLATSETRSYNEAGELTRSYRTVNTFNNTGHITKIETYRDGALYGQTNIEYQGNLSIPFDLEELDS